MRRAGLFHTGYGGDLFQFFVWDASSSSERSTLRSIVGVDAERLIWHLGTVNRGELLGLRDVMNASVLAQPRLLNASLPQHLVVANRLEGFSAVSQRDVANIMMITIADYLEQMVDVNAWRDVHQIERPLQLYPGSGQPSIAFHWASAICHAIRTSLEVRVVHACQIEKLDAKGVYHAPDQCDPPAGAGDPTGLQLLYICDQLQG